MRVPILLLLAALLIGPAASAAPRDTITQAVLEPDMKAKGDLLRTLATTPDPVIPELFAAWKEDSIYLLPGADPAAPKIPVTLGPDKTTDGSQPALRVDSGAPLLDPAGQPVLVKPAGLPTADHNGSLRQLMKAVLDQFALSDPDPAKRLAVIQATGLGQDVTKLDGLLARQKVETDPAVQAALAQSVSFIQLKDAKDEVKTAALQQIAILHPLAARDLVAAFVKDTEGKSSPAVAAEAQKTLKAIEDHLNFVTTCGTLFRGLSSGSILLVAAIGLSITFGLMGVINMAHGEMIAVGAYTTYVVQNLFDKGLALSPFGYSLSLPGLHCTGAAQDIYFLVALPLSFLSAAFVGIALERGIIQFLYRRPLESLLATWGISLILQQLFRMIFGSNNVQVYSPAYLSGNWLLNDVQFGWNRLFVIGFAIFIIVGVWLLLSKTPLGLLIRAVMQNRNMAACMGVRTERVNMLTFGLGSGLAGLAGAFLSQIGNVGPALGQDYIVDCFMTVVVGGVGTLAGTVVSALGIGLLDQSLQQILLNPVLGKILVLCAIILFLQWKPAGLFVVKSRSLES